MTDKEILQKAIEKVIKSDNFIWNGYIIPKHSSFSVDLCDTANGKYLIKIDNGGVLHHYGIAMETFIFSHDFAKAFFGTTKSISLEYKFDNGLEAKPTTYGTVIFNWEYHLMEMVRKENPIQYLKQFIYD